MGTHTNKHTYLDVHALMILKNNGAGDLAELLCACLAFRVAHAFNPSRGQPGLHKTLSQEKNNNKKQVTQKCRYDILWLIFLFLFFSFFFFIKTE